jgi:hypothetical protein
MIVSPIFGVAVKGHNEERRGSLLSVLLPPSQIDHILSSEACLGLFSKLLFM